MKYYQDITIIPGDGMSLYPIWEKVYQQVHLALVEHSFEVDEEIGNKREMRRVKKSKVGLAFPNYHQKKHQLGNKLRLLSMSESDIHVLNLDQYFNRLEDYVHKTRIKLVSENKVTGYAFFKRFSTKGNVERLARRRQKRLTAKGIETSYEKALDYFQNSQDRKASDKIKTRAPFVYLNSETSKQRFPLFIEMVTTEQLPDKAEFSCYGLSASCSVPLF